MPLAPSLPRPDSRTVALDWVPLLHSSLVDTPPPVSSLAKSSVVAASHGTTPIEPVKLPEPGAEFCGFHLVEELGRGTFARVYLARQAALANREVAVKVTLKATKEPERLARLQHTNVVPVYSVHEAEPAQVICMPYLGRRTLADALTGFRKSHAHAPAAGLSTRKAAIATKKNSSVAGSRVGSATTGEEPKTGSRPTLPAVTTASVGNVEAVLEILLQLADGLGHAHERGVLHLDLKPANVLLADTGEPMLLDFNLSYAEAEGKREVVGGTIPYMAPEQLIDLRQRGKGSVDARTDLYSLGVMTFELLTGKHPFPVTSRSLAEFDGLIAARNNGAPNLRDVSADIPAAVASIVAKLLAAKPEDRYQSARDLREDVDRQLSDRPLKFAPDRSIAERMGKWRRRNPKTLFAMLAALVLCAAGGAGAFAFNEIEKRETRDAESRVRATHDGLATARLDLLLPDPATRTRGLKSAVALLAAFDLPQDPQWRSKPAFQKVPADQRAAVSANLGELLLLVAHARLQEGKTADNAAAVNDARMLNELAKGCFEKDAPPMLARQRAEIDREPAPTGAPTTARDYFLDGASLFAARKFDAAVRPLEKAVAAQPDHAAANFLLARCQQQLGSFPASIERFRLAQSLLPNDPRPSHFAGVSLTMIPKFAQAEESFSAALAIDEQFGDSWLARGFVRLELRSWADAERDVTTALERGAPKLQTLTVRAQIRAANGDEDGAAEDRTAAAKLKPEREGDFLTRGYSRLQTSPREAIKDFDAALELNPASITARRNLLVAYDLLRDDAAALKTANGLVSIAPNYAFGRASRALCLARLGKRAEAIEEVQACRKLLGENGPNLRDPAVVYRLALVYSVTSAKVETDRTAAIQLLKESLRTGFSNFAALEKDRDLAAIRELREFQDAVKAARELAN